MSIYKAPEFDTAKHKIVPLSSIKYLLIGGIYLNPINRNFYFPSFNPAGLVIMPSVSFRRICSYDKRSGEHEPYHIYVNQTIAKSMRKHGLVLSIGMQETGLYLTPELVYGFIQILLKRWLR